MTTLNSRFNAVFSVCYHLFLTLKTNNMKFEFGKATDITEFAKKNFEGMYEEYEKIYITTDTNDYHILRILKGYDEDYETNGDKVILEHQMIGKAKQETINSMRKLKSILEEDDGGNYDYEAKDSVDECIEIVDGGFGIN